MTESNIPNCRQEAAPCSELEGASDLLHEALAEARGPALGVRVSSFYVDVISVPKAAVQLDGYGDTSQGNLSAPHPDAGLLWICAAYDELADQVFALYPGGVNAVHDEDERLLCLAPIEEKQQDLLERLYKLKANTIDGLKARVSTLLHADPDFYKLIESGVSGYMVSALVRDLHEFTGGRRAILSGMG